MKKQGKRWTAAYAGEVLDKADRAKSDRAYADARRISAQRLAWWRQRLSRPRRRSGSAGAVQRVEFVEVAAKRPASTTMLEVLLTNGRQLRFTDQVEPETVGRLADALEGQC